MRWKISVLLIAAMLCVALTGIAAAEDIKCCWEKPCGTKVVQCDNETTFTLIKAYDSQIVISIGGYVYVDMDDDDGNYVRAGDIRLTAWHDNYGPNTKVNASDLDNGKSTSIPDQDILTYLDINGNGMFDLYDPVYVDLDNSTDVSDGDIRLTDVPPVDVYYIDGPHAGELLYPAASWNNGQKWTVVNGSTAQQDFGYDLYEIDSGYAWKLLAFMDGDCSGDWTCADKLYLNQPHDDEWWFDKTVTPGDVRIYIPPGDPCVPDCGTKVEQGDDDAVYALMKNLDDARLAYYANGPEEVYIDMDGNNEVSFGDVRLTWVSTVYPPNTKVKVSNEDDLGHVLNHFGDQTLVRYAEKDGLDEYSLGDPLYVDLDNSTDVSDGDIRLTAVPVFNTSNLVAGEIGEAWSIVENDGYTKDADVGTDLFNIGPNDEELYEVLGYIDTDCTLDWTCPDKLYIQQIVDECGEMHDKFVSIGDFRVYVPQKAIDEEGWPECGTKVVQCNVDLVYTLMKADPYIKAGFVNRDNVNGFSAQDNAYLDMDGDGKVSDGDVRLTRVEIKDEIYDPNTKVKEPHDDDLGDELEFYNGYGLPFGILIFVDLNENGVFDVEDPIYLDTNWMGPGFGIGVTANDIRLTQVPVVNGPYGAAGSIGAPWSRVKSNDPDTSWQFFRATIDHFWQTAIVGNHLKIFDADCSGDWTCVDKIYLQQEPFCIFEICMFYNLDNYGYPSYNADIDGLELVSSPDQVIGMPTHHRRIFSSKFVTAGDFRMYMPPCNNSTSTTPEVETFNVMDYDIQNPWEEIDRTEVFNAIDDYFTETITRDQVFAVIAEYFK
jgi:hypothetical protein